MVVSSASRRFASVGCDGLARGEGFFLKSIELIGRRWRESLGAMMMKMKWSGVKEGLLATGNNGLEQLCASWGAYDGFARCRRSDL
jgi:hypothetical protein